MANAEVEKILGWGRCTVSDSEGADWNDLVENSAQLSVQEGQEVEAKIEGGSAEGRKKQPDIYILTHNRRVASAGEVSIGFTENVASVTVTPENDDAVGVTLRNVSKHVSVKFDTTDGTVAVTTYKTKGETNAQGRLTDIELI